ncbi:MAG: hypothetical protein M3371_03175 [Acidobacteriota bacterium]|nr:hypothetical protein [Acidobacteriota bacterium]
MGTTGKQGLTTPPRKRAAATEERTTVNPSALRSDTLGATRAYLKATLDEKRSYVKAAFANPYNLSLFLGGLALAGLTVSPFLALLVICLEALWILYAPGSKFLRRLLWDPQFEQERLRQAEQERADVLSRLDESERARVENLLARHADINRLAAQNPSFTGELLRSEVGKTDRLVNAFIDMTMTCARYEAYLRSINLDELERERRRWESISKRGHEGQDDAETRIAGKNIAIILKRFDKIKEIRQYLTLARGQLSLIENSFQLITDQIVTMQSPQELSGQLNELLDGVESIKQTAAETERLLNPQEFGQPVG